MSKSRHNMLFYCGIAALLCTALLCRVITRFNPFNFEDKLLNLVRILIYIGLISAWGFSIKQRIMQSQVRRILISVSALLVFWLIIREFRFRYIADVEVLRILWYAYYIPLLMIPLLAVFVSLSLGKSDVYRLPRWCALLYIPTIALIILVMTNDFHQLAFTLSNDSPVSEHFNYNYNWLYYVITGWVYLCGILSFVMMTTKLRVPQSKKILFLPLFPFAAALAYGTMYYVRVPFAIHFLGDLAVVFSLIFIAYFECCIRCGLIQSNRYYSDLFRYCTDISAQITDKDKNVVFKASDARELKRGDIEKAELSPIVIDGGMLLHNMPINGGYAIWTEDISELLSLRETLELRKDELTDRNALLRLEYEREKAHRTIEEQNRLYDLLQNKTQSQLNRIETLVSAYETSQSNDEKQQILARLIILGTFIKRSKDFILAAYESPAADTKLLSRALDESFSALRIAGIKGGAFIQDDCNCKNGDKLLYAYGFFESVIEKTMDKMNYINVRLFNVGGLPRLSILTDVRYDFSQLKSAYPKAEIYTEDDGVQLLLPLEGGDAL